LIASDSSPSFPCKFPTQLIAPFFLIYCNKSTLATAATTADAVAIAIVVAVVVATIGPHGYHAAHGSVLRHGGAAVPVAFPRDLEGGLSERQAVRTRYDPIHAIPER
jgi:hypothetical protein